MKKPEVITEAEESMLHEIKKLRFVTAEQLVSIVGVTMTLVRRRLNNLMAKGYLASFKELKPYVYRLSHHGASFVGAEYQARWYSAAAIHQYLMCNSSVIWFKDNYPGVAYQTYSRSYMKDLGFNLAVSEHPGKLGDDRTLSIIDDYYMRPSRILKILERVHANRLMTPTYQKRIENKTVDEAPVWKNYVTKVFVFSVSEPRLKLHQRYLTNSTTSRVVDAKNSYLKNITFSFNLIDPIWRIS